MTGRRCCATLALAGVMVALAAVFASAQGDDQTVPQTPWGAPDLQGVWDFRTITPLQRPEDLGDKAFLTAEEAANLDGGTRAEEREAASQLAGGAVYEFEPDEQEILAELLPRNLAIQVYRALLESAASEQGARMTAMDSATRNAGDMIKNLTLVYNRTRQAYITKELIEIISGAEAV